MIGSRGDVCVASAVTNFRTRAMRAPRNGLSMEWPTAKHAFKEIEKALQHLGHGPSSWLPRTPVHAPLGKHWKRARLKGRKQLALPEGSPLESTHFAAERDLATFTKRITPPAPVERVDGSPQLGFFFGISSQSRRLLGLLFFGHAALVSKTLYLSSVFGSCVSPRSLGGGEGLPPDAQDLHPQHHQDYLVAMNLSLFLQILVVLCCFKRCWKLPVRGLGGAKCSDALRNC